MYTRQSWFSSKILIRQVFVWVTEEKPRFGIFETRASDDVRIMSYIEFTIVNFTTSKRPALKDNFKTFQQQFELSEGGIHEIW